MQKQQDALSVRMNLMSVPCMRPCSAWCVADMEMDTDEGYSPSLAPEAGEPSSRRIRWACAWSLPPGIPPLPERRDPGQGEVHESRAHKRTSTMSRFHAWIAGILPSQEDFMERNRLPPASASSHMSGLWSCSRWASGFDTHAILSTSS